MTSSNKMSIFYIFIFICIIACFGDDDIQRISKKKCKEYGILTKSEPCTESSSTEGRAKFGDYPHMAVFGFNDLLTNVQWLCAGTLISEQYVLTAAHCLANQNHSLFVRFGDLDIKSDADNFNIQDIKVAKKILHPNYLYPLLNNDVALIKLEKPVQFNEYIRPACLPDADEVIDFVNQKFIKSGWRILPKKNVELKTDLWYNKNIVAVPYEICKEKYDRNVGSENIIDQNNHLCIGPHEEECLIISGSPIQIKDKDNECMYKIMGFVSFAVNKCENYTPEVSTKVSAYIDWIEKIVWA